MKWLVLIWCLLISILASAQKMPSDYFEEADRFYEVGKLKEALKSYQFIVDNYSSDELYPRALYNVGYLQYLNEDYDNSLKTFKEILKNNFNEMDASGADIMGDPFNNYKHRASTMVSNIYYARLQFDSALVYLGLADTVYQYMHFCGNAYEAYEISKALRYADIFQKMELPDKAIEKLLPAVFISFEDNTEIINTLRNLLADKKNVKHELDLALNNIYPVRFKNDKYRPVRYFFKFLNQEIEVPSDYEEVEEKIFNKEKSIRYIRKTKLYKMIEEL